MQRNMPKNRSGGRGGSGNRGGNRNFSGNNRSQSQAFASSGPPVNDHLQLHELDLELALLKRKREIIEQQQNMLSSTLQMSQSNFDEPRPSYGQQFNKPSRSFVDYYDESPGQQTGRFDRQPSFKRSATDDVWESNQNRFPGPKRQALNSGPQRSNIPARISARPPQNANRKPGFDTSMRGRPSVRPRSRGVKNRTNFKPTPNVAPNKLNTHPTPERKKLVAQAEALVQPAQEQYILDPNNPIHHKVLGRLELSLGAILRELKEAFGSVEPYIESLQSPTSLRNIKQGIRDRLRSLMMGKIVGPAKETIGVYRQHYPKSTDEAFLKAVLESHTKKRALAIDIFQSGNPEVYFKKNFTRLLSTSLERMFGKVQNYHENNPISNIPLKEIINEILNTLANETNDQTSNEAEKTQIQPEIEIKAAENESKETDVANIEMATTNDPQDVEKQDVEKQNVEKQDVEKQDVEKQVAEKQDAEKQDADMQDTEKQDAEKQDAEKQDADIQDANNAKQKEANIREGTETTTTEEDKTVQVENNETEKTETAKGDIEKTGQKAKSTPSAKTDGTTKRKRAISEMKPDDDGLSLFVSSTRFYHVLTKTLIEKHLPVILPTFKSDLMKILNNDEDFKTTKAYLLKTTDEKIAKILDRQQNAENASVPAKKPKKQQQTFVKIVGRPALPKKKLMKTFLDSFHPTLIKRHRRLHNILFVAFDQAENLENICAKNGTTIANCKLDIRVSDKMIQNNGGGVDNDGDVEMVNDSIDNVIDDTLDDQINDLLSSLRQEEEKNQVPPSEESAVNEVTIEEGNPEVVSTKEESQQGEETGKLQDVADAEAAVAEAAVAEAAVAETADAEAAEDEATQIDEEEALIGEEDGQNEEESALNGEENAQIGKESGEKEDDPKLTVEAKDVPKAVEAAKTEENQGTATPTRTSARLASSITTRRASKKI